MIIKGRNLRILWISVCMCWGIKNMKTRRRFLPNVLQQDKIFIKVKEDLWKQLLYAMIKIIQELSPFVRRKLAIFNHGSSTCIQDAVLPLKERYVAMFI